MVGKEGAAPSFFAYQASVLLLNYMPHRNWLPGPDSHRHDLGQSQAGYCYLTRQKTGPHARTCTEKPLFLRQRGMLDSRHVRMVAEAGLAPAPSGFKARRATVTPLGKNHSHAGTYGHSVPGIQRFIACRFRMPLLLRQIDRTFTVSASWL
jgi:hypothetical protein